MILYPNAKINIGLKILNKREDNYHNISSVFVPVCLTDILEFSVVKNAEFNFIQSGLKIDDNPENNLCVQVYKYFKDNYNIPLLQIHLHKQIPTQAGLGGGSADASFFIKGLNDHFNLKLSNEKLMEISLMFGSDCPFFVKNKVSIVQGRGEIINPIDLNLSEYHVIIIKPDISVSTKDAYSNILPNDNKSDLEIILNKDISGWKDKINNDFERSVFEKYPQLNNIKNTLYSKGALYAQMSGSGSAIFGIFKEKNLQINKLFENSMVFWTRFN